MCGINGIFSIGTALPHDVEGLIRQMNRALKHRGPDDEGVLVDQQSGLALGHRRLSIIDLSASGHQPMQDEASNSIVFNGEIYNYSELKDILPKKKYRSSSDTEVLMTLLATKGATALNYLNGMFAFAWYDNSKQELLLVRDRAGKKPLYYCALNGLFGFSSEIKALLTLPWITSKVDDQAMYHFLTFNQLEAPQTMFQNIFKIGPAESILVNKSGIKEKQIWWKPEYTDYSNESENTLSDRIYAELQKSVNYRMVADVPVGAFLSGGVDSSAVVALMRQNSSSVIKTYSVGFEGQPDYDERIYAEKISKMFNTEHHEKIVSSKDIEEHLNDVINAFDEPMADATCIPIWFISKLAKENNTIVVQTGDGADELFAGYRGWQKYIRLYPGFHKFSALPSIVRKSLKPVSSLFDEGSPSGEIFQRGIKGQELFWGGARAFKESTKQQFLQQNWLNKIPEKDSYSVIATHRSNFLKLKQQHPALTDIDWMCYLGFHSQIPNKYLYRMDRLGMANSIEIRSPFLDFNLINVALSIPGKLKIKNGEPKYILKKSLEKILPAEILYRRKMGFCVPLREWAGELMIEYVEANMHNFCSNTGIFEESGLKHHLKEIKNGNVNYTNNLWTVYYLMSWFKKWM